MILAVTDTETTGLADNDQVCEMGIALLVDTKIEHIWRSFVNPTCTMSIGARATHHITDEELVSAPTMTEMLLRRGLPEFGRLPEAANAQGAIYFPEQSENLSALQLQPQDVVFAAHNAAFDRRMLVQSGIHPDLLPIQTICTWKCSRHLYPDAPGHSNQILRYYLDIQPAFEVEGVPHRALPDVAVTMGILLKMLEQNTPEKLIELTATPVLLEKASFGRFRGKLWRDFDVGMLRWVLGKDFDEDEKYTAQYWLNEKTKM